MTTRSRSALARLATASLLAAGLTGLTAVTARAAAGCSNDGVGTVTVALDGSPSTITAPVANLDPFVVDGSSTNCDSGTQTVHVVGTAGDDTVRLRFVASGQIVTGGLLTADKAELQVDLAGGNDTLIIETTPFADTVASSAVGISVTSQSQDVATDSVEAVTVETGAGDDTVDLSADADYAVPTSVQPGAGLDTVTGGAAGDTFVATPAGDTSDAEADSFTGGGGADAVDYTARLGSVTVDVGTPAGSGETGEGDTVGTDIETFRTGPGDDTVFGDNFGQTIETGDGNDSVYPMGGDDTVDVGTGGDNVDAGSGDDGADTYLGSSDATLDYTGRSVALTINLVLADEVGEPGEGDMVAGFGTVKGGSGADTIVGTTMAEHLIGGPGKDVITGGGGADVLEGDGGNDTFPQGAAPDGSDTVVGGSGIDRIDYSQRTTRVVATLGGHGGGAGESDTIGLDVEAISGGHAGDSLTGSSLANTFYANQGDDVIRGMGGADTEQGGPGNDVLLQDAAANGGDVLSGGTGVDRVDYSGRGAAVKVTLDNRANDGTGSEGDNVKSDVENVRGGRGADTLTGSSVANTLEGLAGNDVLDGQGGIDRLVCGTGADRAVRRTGDRYSACETIR